MTEKKGVEKSCLQFMWTVVNEMSIEAVGDHILNKWEELVFKKP